MAFINDDFMLKTGVGRKLYHTYAEKLPIIDYHCHLSPAEIAEDHRFSDATELFLGGDHYKWRQMRTNGVPEELITGKGDAREKWRAFADTHIRLIGNPLFHWTQLELARYFDVYDILSPDNADRIYEEVGEKLRSPDFSAKNLITRSRVRVVCTTDDPTSNLESHIAIKESGFSTKVLPTFRPDKAVAIDKADFVPYVKSLGVKTFADLLAWLSSRIAFFALNGCRLADHGLDYVPYGEGDAESVFRRVLAGEKAESLGQNEIDAYKTAVILHCAKEYTARNMTMQVHFGALRNNSTRRYLALGADTGFDSIGDTPSAKPLSKLLDLLERNGALPKTVLYPLNPKDNFVVGSMIGNFQGSPAGKMQFGSGWWFNDQKDGMKEQLRTLGNLGMLSRFVGMLTDSRSFISYTRHEYFRRIFCDFIGALCENGEYPTDEKYLKPIVEGVCYYNAESYFAF